jgi:hypothetical protein
MDAIVLKTYLHCVVYRPVLWKIRHALLLHGRPDCRASNKGHDVEQASSLPAQNGCGVSASTCRPSHTGHAACAPRDM